MNGMDCSLLHGTCRGRERHRLDGPLASAPALTLSMPLWGFRCNHGAMEAQLWCKDCSEVLFCHRTSELILVRWGFLLDVPVDTSLASWNVGHLAEGSMSHLLSTFSNLKYAGAVG